MRQRVQLRRDFASAAILALMAPTVAMASPRDSARAVSRPAQFLAAGLRALARLHDIELLFSQTVVGDRLASAVAGRFSAREAVELVLVGSPLVLRITPDGSFLIAAAPMAESEQPVATPEILVIGHKSQNTDVRRTKNDVRPYHVVTRRDVATSHVSTIEELAAKRLPANAKGATLSQQAAVRRDLVTTQAVQSSLAIGDGGTRTVRSGETVYTAGFKASPVEGILVRGSLSTGQQPLTTSELSRIILPDLTLHDHRRGGEAQFFEDVSGGPPNPKPARARSLSAGIVVQPPGVPSLRLSLDYTRID